MSLDQQFFALSDPTRRAVLARIKDGPQPVGIIADSLPVSRPAVSQHLKILKQAELVQEEKKGTRSYYGLSPTGLGAIKEFIEDYWRIAIGNFAAYAEATAKEPGEDR